MDEIFRSLAHRALEKLASCDGQRIIIAIAGVPGSGKTTLANHVAGLLNEGLSDRLAVTVPMDGFHLSRAQLDQMPNPKEAHLRRGAPWTFNGHGVVNLVKHLREQNGDDIYAPLFDHKHKDPIENGLVIRPATRIILLEGLYLLLTDEPWCQITNYTDDSWFITVSPNRAIARVGRRHVAAGITPTLELGLQRAELVDAINGNLITSHSKKPHVIIESFEGQYDSGTGRHTKSYEDPNEATQNDLGDIHSEKIDLHSDVANSHRRQSRKEVA
jgi:pantothenate kinase